MGKALTEPTDEELAEEFSKVREELITMYEGSDEYEKVKAFAKNMSDNDAEHLLDLVGINYVETFHKFYESMSKSKVTNKIAALMELNPALLDMYEIVDRYGPELIPLVGKGELTIIQALSRITDEKAKQH